MKRLLRFFTYLKPFTRKIILLFCLVLASTLVSLPLPLLEKKIIDDAIPDKNITVLFWLVGAIGAFYCLNQTLAFFRNKLSITLREKVLTRVRFDLYRHIQKLSMSFFSKQQSGALLSRMLTDVSFIQNLVNDEFFVLISSFIRVGIVLTLLFNISWELSLMCLAVLPPIIIIFGVYKNKMYAFNKRLQEAFAFFSGKVQENLGAIKLIQAETVEELKAEETHGYCRNLENVNIEQARVAIGGNYLVTLLSYIPLLLIMWGIGGSFVIEEKISLGSLLAFIQYLFGVIGPVTQFFRFNMSLQAGYAALDRINEIFNKPPEVADKPAAIPLQGTIDSIRFSHISLHFPAGSGEAAIGEAAIGEAAIGKAAIGKAAAEKTGKERIAALSDLDLVIKRGERVGIVGASGGGKTSLVNLLLRFYNPTAGEVLINDRPIETFTTRSLRTKIAYMPQEEFLFNDTVRANLTLGRSYGEAELEQALRVAHALDFVRGLEAGLETVIGERGVTLSGGERQRLALSRLFLKNPDLFVFDEAFSALDAASEQLVLDALDRIIARRTVILIAHRFTFLQLVDRILVFDQGRLAEDGTFDVLLNKGGIFSRLYASQKPVTPYN
jgi:ABC-type multidrug transport system fused ATPase/permease subunit